MIYDWPYYCLCCGIPLDNFHGPGWCKDCFNYTHYGPYGCLKCDKHCENQVHKNKPQTRLFSSNREEWP